MPRQIEALIFFFLMNILHFELDMILLSNLVQILKQLWLKMVKKIKVRYENALIEGKNGKKCNFFSFLIKLNIRASISSALLTKKYSTARVTSKIHAFRKF